LLHSFIVRHTYDASGPFHPHSTERQSRVAVNLPVEVYEYIFITYLVFVLICEREEKLRTPTAVEPALIWRSCVPLPPRRRRGKCILANRLPFQSTVMGDTRYWTASTEQRRHLSTTVRTDAEDDRLREGVGLVIDGQPVRFQPEPD